METKTVTFDNDLERILEAFKVVFTSQAKVHCDIAKILKILAMSEDKNEKTDRTDRTASVIGFETKRKNKYGFRKPKKTAETQTAEMTEIQQTQKRIGFDLPFQIN